MPDHHSTPRRESALPASGSRVNLALTLLHPDAADIDTVVAERIAATHSVDVTAAHIAALRAGESDNVPEDVIAAVVDSTQLPHEVLFGDDPGVVLPAWDSLRALHELHTATPGLVQLRADAALSPQAREDLLDLLNPDRRHQDRLP